MAHYRLVDYATQAYQLVVACLIAAFGRGRVPHWAPLIALHAAGLLTVHLLVMAHGRRPASAALAFLRHFYPILLFTGFYRETGLLNTMIVGNYLDPFFIRLEEQLFGCQPSLDLMRWLPCLAVSELLYASYFCFYVMVVGVGLALYVQDKGRFAHYISIVAFVFYACYLAFIFLPAAGPSLFWTEGPRSLRAHGLPAWQPEFPAAVQRGPFFQLMKLIYRSFELPGGAFPSSHVAVAICTALFSWRYLPRIRHIHVVVVVLLCFATVYCRYHYVVDVVAGVAVAAALVPLAEWLHKRLAKGSADV